MPRAHSSPSPPSQKLSGGHGEKSKRHAQSSTRRSSRRRPSYSAPSMGWSTSYQAGSSSSVLDRSGESDSDDSDGDHASPRRGRTESIITLEPGALRSFTINARDRPPSPSLLAESSSSNGSSRRRRNIATKRSTFTHSDSPDVRPIPQGPTLLSPSVRFRPVPVFRNLLPANLSLQIVIPMTGTAWTTTIDAKKAGECLLLLGSLTYSTAKLLDGPNRSTATVWLSIELSLLIIASSIYIIWSHASITSLQPQPRSPPQRPATNTRAEEGRDPKRTAATRSNPGKDTFGYIWMSVPKNYRESSDDGILTGLLITPLIATALLNSSLTLIKSRPDISSSPLPPSWLIEPPAGLSSQAGAANPLQALVVAHYSLVNLATFCSTIFLFNICASWWLEAHCRRRSKSNASNDVRESVPRSETKKLLYYILFTCAVTLGSVGLRFALGVAGMPIWQHLTYVEVVTSAVFYQSTLYIALRLAHRVFTLGELGLVCFGGTSLWMELMNITMARIWPATTPLIKTYRLPTPLLILQLALIGGSLLTGFLLSPLLVLCRHIAQRPVKRLRFPQEKPQHRRALATAFYISSLLIIGGLVGQWTRWCLDFRDPWLWVLRWILQGTRWWTRPALLTYWGVLCSISVSGWNRQLARSRKFRSRNMPPNGLWEPPNWLSDVVTERSESSPTSTISQAPTSAMGNNEGGPLGGLTLPTGTNVSNVATDLLDAADKHVPTLSLNARRKFFHGLAMVMFLPGVLIDPAFAHLSFSAAFALFIFAEYVRYFALWPFSAAVYLFMYEFLDQKDAGTVILSHFYLLTGCAGAVWLEGRTRLLQITGILALGMGDALASVVGKRVGKTRWSPTTFKTLEGSAAFALSIVACAWIARLLGLVEPFSIWGYSLIVGLSAVLEALSAQNDNLVLPLYMWSMLTLAQVC